MPDCKAMTRRKNFILKVLILLGLIAIFASLYVQYGIPYQEEAARQKNDERRIADLDMLNLEIERILAADPAADIGPPNTVYLSLPSSEADCSPYELPSLPDGWKYHCAAGNEYTNPDGSGWIPLALPIAELPIDPLNTPETLNYYAYVATTTIATSTVATTSTGSIGPQQASSPQASTQFVLTAVLDSKKYLIEKAHEDGGSDPIRYEVGHLPKLWSDANGLLGYWPLNEAGGSVSRDISGNNLYGQALGERKNEYEMGFFDGDSNYIYLASNGPINNLGATSSGYTIALEFKTNSTKNASLTEKWIDGGAYPFTLRLENSQVVFGTYDGKKWIGTSASGIKFGLWNTVIASVNMGSNSINIYLNGELGGTIPYQFRKTANTSGVTIGTRNLKKEFLFSGSIKNLRFYDRAINSVELNRLFISAQ